MLDRGKRLSGDAREVLLLAEDEARSLNHNYLGTEHILLGLLAARHSIAARILARAGADQEEARAAVERIIGCGPQQPATGPLALTPQAKKVLSHARKEAKFDHSMHTRGQHLLFGILRERDGVAAQVLTSLGVDRADVGKRIARITRACSFCARNGAEVANLIAGPQVFICDRCAREATRLTAEAAAERAHAALTLVPAGQQDANCSFCGKHRADVEHLVTGPGASICAECLTICREINDEEGITEPSNTPFPAPEPQELRAGRLPAKLAPLEAILSGSPTCSGSATPRPSATAPSCTGSLWATPGRVALALARPAAAEGPQGRG